MQRFNRKHGGFTLIELLVVVAIIALLVSILLPSLSRARKQARRAVSATRVRGLALACTMFSSDARDKFPGELANDPSNNGTSREVQKFGSVPRNTSASVTWAGAIGNNATKDRDVVTATSDTNISPTRAMYVLVRSGDVNAEQFVNPNTSQDVDPDPRSAYYDFYGGENISYAYQNIFGSQARPSVSLLAGVGLIADRNPYYTEGPGAATGRTGTVAEINAAQATAITGTTGQTIDNRTDEQLKLINSPNEDGEGQNIGFTDASVQFKTDPYAGVGRDNIYTSRSGAASSTVEQDRLRGNTASLGSGFGISNDVPKNGEDTHLIP